MEVILLSDVEHVGLRGDVVSVARGYARNYLLPRQLAEEATPARVAELEKRDAQRARHEAKTAEQAQEIADTLSQTVLRFEVKAGPTGSLFGSVTPTDIVDELWSSKKIRVDRRKIETDPHQADRPLRDPDRRSSRTCASRSRPRSSPRAASCRPTRSSQEMEAAERAEQEEAAAEQEPPPSSRRSSPRPTPPRLRRPQRQKRRKPKASPHRRESRRPKPRRKPSPSGGPTPTRRSPRSNAS